jgi:TNF receptor-associated protein 1
MEFKAEVQKLLHIVSKSIYKDKEVFLRELLSNCSDALEKQRYAEISGKDTHQITPNKEGEQHFIEITTDEKERVLEIYDSGIGMTREQTIDNLGTIAKSGSQEFKNLFDQSSDSQMVAENIIGQFGVGFYSSFIVANHVDVYTKSAESSHGVKWSSDGSGDYSVGTIDNLDFERGTKIVLRLKKECGQFVREGELEKIIKKYSIFNKYPIRLNGYLVNS